MTAKPGELSLVLNGVDHTARPTWKLRETVEFYRDKLGLPLVHAITAKGWGRAKEQHADFVHFFFEAGKGSTIAFFYYIGTDQPPEIMVPREHAEFTQRHAGGRELAKTHQGHLDQLAAHQLDPAGAGLDQVFEGRVSSRRDHSINHG